VDTELERDGKLYRFVDTAGIRRKGKTHLMAEKLSVVMSRKHLEDADIALVISGGHAVTCRAAVNRLREQGVKVGMARLLWVRPFPSEDLRAALGGVKAVGVVETNLGLGGASYGGILSLDVTTALYQMTGERPLVTSFMAGLGGETVPAFVPVETASTPLRR